MNSNTAKILGLYALIFVLGMCTYWSAYWFLGLHEQNIYPLGLNAGLSAVIAAFLVRKPYWRNLENGSKGHLYGWLLTAVLLSHLLYGPLLIIAGNIRGPAMMPLHEWLASSIMFSLFSLIFGFIQNMLLGAMLTESLWRWRFPCKATQQ